MPIDADEWNSGKKVHPLSLKEKILLFLKNNPDKAFNIKEIIEGTGYSIQVVMLDYGPIPELQFHHTLEKLAEDGLVEIRLIKKTIGEEMYFKVVNVDPKTPKNIP